MEVKRRKILDVKLARNVLVEVVLVRSKCKKCRCRVNKFSVFGSYLGGETLPRPHQTARLWFLSQLHIAKHLQLWFRVFGRLHLCHWWESDEPPVYAVFCGFGSSQHQHTLLLLQTCTDVHVCRSYSIYCVTISKPLIFGVGG